MSADVKKSMKLLGSFRPLKAAKSGIEDRGVEILLVHHTFRGYKIFVTDLFRPFHEKQVKQK